MTNHFGKTALTEIVEGLEGCPEWGTNAGHGHVWKRPDGQRARCGGPSICSQCAKDLARSRSCQPPDPDRIKAIAEYVGELEEQNRQLAMSAKYAIEAHATGRFEPAQAAVENLKNTLDDFYAACEANDQP